jgi:antibiotic biosynthesis monooxygenase (ABM) superfamily enzyme
MSLSPRFRLALVLAGFVYPVITAYLYVLGPLTPGWQMWQRTIVLVPMMVLTIVFGLIPMINRFFGRFIAGRGAGAK